MPFDVHKPAAGSGVGPPQVDISKITAVTITDPSSLVEMRVNTTNEQFNQEEINGDDDDGVEMEEEVWELLIIDLIWIDH